MLQYLITTEKTLYLGDGDKRTGSRGDDNNIYHKRLHTNLTESSLHLEDEWGGGGGGLSTEEGKDRK
jgi:hypothetical protein